MSRNPSTAAFLISLFFFARGMAAPAAAAAPSPEIKSLDYFVGKWSFEGALKEGPWGPGGKVTRSDTCRLMDGGFFLVIDSEGQMASAPRKSLGVMGWNAVDNVFSYHSFDSNGTYESGKGTKTGETWLWLGKTKMGDKESKVKLTFKVTSPTSYELSEEISTDGTTYTPFLDGKATKVK